MDLNLPTWLHDLGRTGLTLLPGGVFTVWCLFGVNWRRAWPVLAARQRSATPRRASG